MNLIWDWIKDKRPVDISLKKRMEGDVAVIYGKSLEICYLNKVGSQIVQYSDGKKTLSEISVKLLDIYEVDEKILQNDIVELIRDMQWKRLIKLEG